MGCGDRPWTRKRPKELVGHQPFGGSGGFSKLQSLVAAGSLARWPCDPRTRFPGPPRGSLLAAVWRFTPAPSGETNVRAATGEPQRAYPRTWSGSPRPYPRTCERCGRVVDTRPGGVGAMAHLLTRLVALNDRW